MSTVLLILLILACPLMMIFMMRGGHGHGGHSQGDHSGHGQAAGANGRSDGEPRHVHDEHCRHDDESLDDLKRSRDELDERIVAREQEERAGVGA